MATRPPSWTFATATPTEVEVAEAIQRMVPNADAQLRLEAFNVFNHTELSEIDTGIGSSTFGQAITTYDPRILQVALRLSF